MKMDGGHRRLLARRALRELRAPIHAYPACAIEHSSAHSSHSLAPSRPSDDMAAERHAKPPPLPLDRDPPAPKRQTRAPRLLEPLDPTACPLPLLSYACPPLTRSKYRKVLRWVLPPTSGLWETA